MQAKLASEVADLNQEETPSRFVVGVNLGTTNCALCFVDTAQTAAGKAPADARANIQTFSIPQLTAPGQVEPRETLPSFHYQPADGLDPQLFRLPGRKSSGSSLDVVGVLAREQAALTPGRVITSAKSWLCHSGVDRTSELLPWNGASDVRRLSPVEASSQYLLHLREAWNARFPQDPLEQQDVVLTLPASFDEVARELTVEAARRAGLPRVVLIEEPQAAFYSWLHRHANHWTEQISAGHRILVCDVGGGTSDFTLIHVEPGDEPNAPVKLHRAAVGDHLILGGDNFDLALAQTLEREAMGEERLPPRQWESLWKQCRAAKEQLFNDASPEHWHVHLPAEGSKLIGGGKQIEIRRDEMRDQLLDGFFPLAALHESPDRSSTGFQEFGLPYATDPAITKHLAEFLRQHPRRDAAANDPLAVRPDAVLFNGGVFLADRIRLRILDALQLWFADDDPQWRPLELDHGRLDLAVAQGAAYYGLVRRGEGVRIDAGLARTYYVGVGGEPPTAVCLAPAGIPAGREIQLQKRFQLLINRPVVFPLYSSSVRLEDQPGDLTPLDDEQLRRLAPITTVVQGQSRKELGELEVELLARTTEIGALELWCRDVESRRCWRLQFDVRAATETDRSSQESTGEQYGLVDEEAWQQCAAMLRGAFAAPFESPAGLMKRLGEALRQPRQDWLPTLLRRMWEELFELNDGRRRSAAHEARWLNLVGFALRPGYGVALDDWRVDETWKLLQGKLMHAAAECRSESWILWRRIAGGLSSGQQQALADPLLKSVRQLHRKLSRGGKQASMKGLDFSAHEAAEMWRLLGSLERLPLRTKIELGDMLASLADQPKAKPLREGLLWALRARAPAFLLMAC